MLPRTAIFILSGLAVLFLVHVVGYASGVPPPTRAHQAMADALAQSRFMAPPPHLKKIVVFGDSLSDDG